MIDLKWRYLCTLVKQLQYKQVQYCILLYWFQNNIVCADTQCICQCSFVHLIFIDSFHIDFLEIFFSNHNQNKYQLLFSFSFRLKCRVLLVMNMFFLSCYRYFIDFKNAAKFSNRKLARALYYDTFWCIFESKTSLKYIMYRGFSIN